MEATLTLSMKPWKVLTRLVEMGIFMRVFEAGRIENIAPSICSSWIWKLKFIVLRGKTMTSLGSTSAGDS